jgi:hypothetical protein
MKLFSKSGALTLILGLILSSILLITSASAANERECDDNAIIRCGALSETELQQKCRENQGDVQAIFREFGIANCNVLSGLVEGHVTGKNEVFVSDKLVATGAVTAGRHNIAGSTPIAGGIAFKRPPSVSFVDKNGSLRSLIKMDGDKFLFGVITSCGNPVAATPILPPPPVTTNPTPPPPIQKTEVVKKQKPGPKRIPSTGPNSIAGMFIATSIAAYGAHQIVNRLSYRLRLK